MMKKISQSTQGAIFKAPEARIFLCFVLSFFAVLWIGMTAARAYHPGTPTQSKYNFIFRYDDGSKDYYIGYVFAPHGISVVGQSLYFQPEEMGGANMGGHYEITAINNGFDLSYGAKSYITDYYDGHTGKSSNQLFFTAFAKTVSLSHSIYVANRTIRAEIGYVYDPLVPATDTYFGNPDICYDFSTETSEGNNFLAQYITDLPYWNQPNLTWYIGKTDYAGVCAEVAGAILLAYWDQHGYDNLLSTIWSDNTHFLDYTAFIWDLCNKMSYDSTKEWWDWNGVGTRIYNTGAGLEEYAKSKGYYNFNADPNSYGEPDNQYAFRDWTTLTKTLDARPIILGLRFDYNVNDISGTVGHAVVARGYWDDGRVVCNLGWGSELIEVNESELTNLVLDWSRGGSFSYVYDGYTMSYYASIIAVLDFKP